VLFIDSTCSLPSAIAKRFSVLPFAAQCSTLHALRWTVFPEGVFLQVPPAEWWRLLCLVDPVIHISTRTDGVYQIAEGRGLLMLLLNHYLDVH